MGDPFFGAKWASNVGMGVCWSMGVRGAATGLWCIAGDFLKVLQVVKWSKPWHLCENPRACQFEVMDGAGVPHLCMGQKEGVAAGVQGAQLAAPSIYSKLNMPFKC